MENIKVNNAHKKLISKISKFTNVDSYLENILKKSLQDMYDLGHADGYAICYTQQFEDEFDDFNDEFTS